MTAAKKKISYLGLLKFIGVCAIMYYHTLPSEHSFSSLYLFVEFFFIITGYMTFKHFQSDGQALCGNGIEEKSQNAIRYTLKKFIGMIPYVVIALIMMYGLELIKAIAAGGEAVADLLKSMPADILLLNSQTGASEWPIWFLSAMIIAFPVFTLVCQIKHTKTLYIFAATFSVVYYFSFFNADIFFWKAILRAFAGMVLGIVCYGLAEKIGSLNVSKGGAVWLQILQTVVFLLAVFSMYPARTSENAGFFMKETVLLFFIHLTLLLSGKTPTHNISCRVFDFLEKISMILFLVHIPWMMIWNEFPIGISYYPKRALELLSCIAVSIILYLIVEKIRKNKIKKAK